MSEPKRVLLLGDSIRMSYQPAVAARLEGRAEVVGPADNCRYSLYTHSRLEAWLDEFSGPSVVHWNNGLWDVGHHPDRGPQQFALKDYVHNLRSVLGRLQSLNVPIIWATTTPVHPKREWGGNGWNWRNEEIDAFNDAATELMRSEGIQIHDLNALVRANPDENLTDDMLHLSDVGVQRCADAVAQTVAAHL